MAGQRLPARHGDRLEAGVCPDRVEQVADVVADRFAAQVQVLGDLRRRAAALELTQDLGLSGRETELRVGLRLLDQVRDLVEEADLVFAPLQGHRADLDRDPAAVLNVRGCTCSRSARSMARMWACRGCIVSR